MYVLYKYVYISISNRATLSILTLLILLLHKINFSGKHESDLNKDNNKENKENSTSEKVSEIIIHY